MRARHIERTITAIRAVAIDQSQQVPAVVAVKLALRRYTNAAASVRG
jgi:hypothetical protein